jgi:agmatinase
MKLNQKQFLLDDPTFTNFEKAAAVIVPVPYEGGTSYGKGTALAPQAVIDASYFVEFYDEIIKAEPYRMGISTMAPVRQPRGQGIHELVCNTAGELLGQNKFIAMLGGDHSVSYGCFKALHEKYPACGVIQLDAHADLRQSYENSPFSHACIMARLRELTQDALQIGIRSLSVEEAQDIDKHHYQVCTMHDYRTGNFDLMAALQKLPDSVYLTVDVDVFDWSVIRSTGTPEPGGFTWDEGVNLLSTIFSRKTVTGFDLVELSHSPHDANSTFAVAKLLYKMFGFKLQKLVETKLKTWPVVPNGPLF